MEGKEVLTALRLAASVLQDRVLKTKQSINNSTDMHIQYAETLMKCSRKAEPLIGCVYNKQTIQYIAVVKCNNARKGCRKWVTIL